ncbi:MAG TPA: c-type cytochrome [Terriglobia bacterium]|nr:c-type cytochrome [Terriglobia bacterium]
MNISYALTAIMMKISRVMGIPVLLAAAAALAAPQGRGGQAPSPASQRPPRSTTPQTYAPELISAGQVRFASQCGFCHGRDAAGGETGPDLTRSALVAEDVRGDRVGPVVRSGRQEKGMPAFDVSESDLAAMVAFIHDQKTQMESLGGNRRSVDAADLRTGNADAGRRYFEGAGNCSKCHSASGDLAGIAARFQGLPLLQRMLYPTSGRPAPQPAKVRVTLPSGETVAGSLVSQDEFVITMTDGSGMRRSWNVADVKFSVDDPLQGHFDLLGKYTDADMHNVYAYLETLR